MGVLLLTAAMAVAPQSPLLERLSPPGGQRGTEIQVEFTGQRLLEPQALVLAQAGIDVLAVTAGSKPETCTASLRVRLDCALGAHQVRLRTLHGLTNPQLFFVGTLPEIAERRDGDGAMRITPGCTVNGSLGNEDVDRYEIELAAGARVQCELQGVRLGSKLLDLVLTVTGPDGLEVARSDDTAFGLKDPVLALRATTPGVHTLRVRTAFADANHAGAYRLHVGTFPRPTGCVPCGGAPGEWLDVKLLGDAALPATTLRVQLPDDSGEPFRCHPEVGGIASPTPILLAVGGPPNRAPTSDDKGRAWVEWPASVHGVVDRPDEPVRFHWRAKKGVELEFKILARALRSPLDAVLIVRDANGRFVASNDDTTGLDPVLRFAAPADGDHSIEVRDVLRRAGDDHFFRLEGAPRADTAALRMVVGRREDAAVVVPCGNRAGALLQWNGLDPEDAALAAIDLPAGTTARFGPLLRGSNLVPVVFTADASAPLAAGLAGFRVRTPDGHAERDAGYLQPIALVHTRNDQPLFGVVQRRLPVATTAPAPFALHLDTPTVPIVRNAPLALGVRIERSDGFAGRVTLRGLWVPPGVTAGQSNVDGPGDRTSVPLSADGNAMVGRFPIAVVGETRLRGGTIVVATDFVELQVDEPWLTASAGAVRTEPGKDVDVRITIAPKNPLAGECRVQLLGLPRGVLCATGVCAATGGDVTLRLQVAAHAAIGRHRGVLVQVLVPRSAAAENETVATVEHRFAAGELRIDAPLATARTEAR